MYIFMIIIVCFTNVYTFQYSLVKNMLLFNCVVVVVCVCFGLFSGISIRLVTTLLIKVLLQRRDCIIL